MQCFIMLDCASIITFHLDVLGSSNRHNDPSGRDYQDETAHQWTIREAHKPIHGNNRYVHVISTGTF